MKTKIVGVNLGQELITVINESAKKNERTRSAEVRFALGKHYCVAPVDKFISIPSSEPAKPMPTMKPFDHVAHNEKLVKEPEKAPPPPRQQMGCSPEFIKELMEKDMREMNEKA